MDDCFVWTENELQFLGTARDFKAKKAYEGVDLECFKENYAQILSMLASHLLQEGSREYFLHNGGIFHERPDCFQNQLASLQV